MTLFMDTSEPNQIWDLLVQSVDVTRMALNHGPEGYADYVHFDWRNPYLGNKLDDTPEAQVFEAGADAMLESLAKVANGKKVWFDRSDQGDLLIIVEY